MVKLLSSEQIGSIENSASEILKLSWWLEIKTVVPPCTYYFGPFSIEKEARFSQYNYVEDLLKKKAHGITVEVKQLQPKELMIYDLWLSNQAQRNNNDRVTQKMIGKSQSSR